MWLKLLGRMFAGGTGTDGALVPTSPVATARDILYKADREYREGSTTGLGGKLDAISNTGSQNL